MAKKKPAKKAPETIDEIFDDAMGRSHKDFDNIPAVTESRRPVVGMEVYIGNLEDCVVVATRHDDRVVLVKYTSVDNNYGNPIRNENQYSAWKWHDMIPKGMQQESSRYFADHWSCDNFRNTDLDGMIGDVLRRGLIDSPDYQRGYVWTEEDKHRYLESVFEKRDLGKFVFVEDRTYNEYRYEILDGKQRLSALMDFYLSRIPYKGVYYHEMHGLDRNAFRSTNVQYATIDKSQVKRSDLLRTFLDINCAGVPQTEEHLEHVRKLYSQALAEEANA